MAVIDYPEARGDRNARAAALSRLDGRACGVMGEERGFGGRLVERSQRVAMTC